MAASSLGDAQRLIWRLVTAPEGVAQGLSDEGDPGGRSLASVLRSDARLGAPARLSVYANAYFYRLRDALRDDFGALHAVLGEKRFHNLVTSYLIAHPPTHPSLRYAGRHLARFLLHTSGGAVFRERCPFAGDLASLEWAILEAFDAPDAPVLEREALARIEPDRWGALRFALSPSLQILTLGSPVQAIRESYDRGGAEAAAGRMVAPEITRLRVWRKRERVFYTPLSGREHTAIDHLGGGASFGDLCGAIAVETGEGAAPREALALLERWLADHLLSEIHNS